MKNEIKTVAQGHGAVEERTTRGLTNQAWASERGVPRVFDGVVLVFHSYAGLKVLAVMNIFADIMVYSFAIRPRGCRDQNAGPDAGR